MYMKTVSRPLSRFRLFLESIPSRVFSIDTRALGVFRILMGCIVVMDVLRRFPHLEAHYTDAGILPRTELLNVGLKFSLHMISGAAPWQAFLLGCELILGLMLIVGYRTRFVTPVLWVFIVSLFNRNTFVNETGDVLFRHMMFWSIFVPWETRFSIDGLRDPSRSRPARILNVGTVALLSQVILIYWYTVWLKSWDSWWHKGSMIAYTFGIEWTATPLADFLAPFLLPHTDLLKFMTRGVFLLELMAPLLLLCPFAMTFIRGATVTAVMLFHAGLGVLLYIGIFPWICVAEMTLFLQAAHWDFLERKLTFLCRVQLPSRWRLVLRRKLPAERLRTGQGSWTNACALFFLLCVLYLNGTTFDGSGMKVPQWLRPVNEIFMLRQSWSMFKSSPPTYYRVAVAGTLADGRKVDLLANEVGFSIEKPEKLTKPYYRWRKYYEKLLVGQVNPAPLGRFLYRRWHKAHRGTKLTRIEMYRVDEPIVRGQLAPKSRLFYSKDFPAEGREKKKPAENPAD